MDYIEKINLQTEGIEEIENLEKHTIINSTPFSVNKYNGHNREFLALDGDYNDGFNQLNETNGLGISCIVSKEVKKAREDINGVFHEDLKDRIDCEVEYLNSSLDNIAHDINKYINFVSGGDWKPALEEALRHTNKVYFPEGNYLMSTVTVGSNIEIYGSGHGTVFTPLGSTLFKVEGQIGEEINVSENVTDFSNIIEIASTEGINVKDYILLKGQRNCLNEEDSGFSWCLGYATPNTRGAYFGEFLQIADMNENSLITYENTIFPSYLNNKDNEVDVYARNCSTVSKVDFVCNVIFRDFKIINTCNPAIRVELGRNIKLDNIYNEVDNYDGNMASLVIFLNSLDCVAENCAYIKNNDLAAEQHHNLNVFRSTSSMRCGFRNCKAVNTTQAVDFSYQSDNICDSLGFAENCEIFNATQSGIISHGGTYKINFSNNKIYNVRQGICCRTRNSIISNNMVTGTRNMTTLLAYGIGLYEGHAVDCVISNNSVSNFYVGLCVADGGNYGESFKQANAVFDGNTVSNCYHGFYIVQCAKSSKQFKNVILSNNSFKHSDADVRCLFLDDGISGVSFIGNTIESTVATTGSGIWCDYNCKKIKATNNIIKGFYNGIFIRGMNNDDTVDTHAYVYDNIYQDCTYGAKLPLHNTLTNERDCNFDKLYLIERSSENINLYPNLSIFCDSEGNLCFKNKNGEVCIIQTI